MRYGTVLVVCMLLASCGVTLKGRLQTDVQSVDYEDGVNMREASILAHHYRLNNLKWYALEQPVDDGEYWSFSLTNGRTGEPTDELPLLIYKKAWSYKSAIVIGKKPTKLPEPGKR